MQTDHCEKRRARRTWCEVVVAGSRSMSMSYVDMRCSYLAICYMACPKYIKVDWALFWLVGNWKFVVQLNTIIETLHKKRKTSIQKKPPRSPLDTVNTRLPSSRTNHCASSLEELCDSTATYCAASLRYLADWLFSWTLPLLEATCVQIGKKKLSYRWQTARHV